MSKKTTNNFTNGESSVIGAGTILEGNLKTNATVRIDGEIKGDLESQATVIVGVDGKINGNVNAVDLLVAGTVTGDVKATNKIEIVAKGKIDGDINTKSLIIDEAAIFHGKCVMDNGQKPEITTVDSKKNEKAK